MINEFILKSNAILFSSILKLKHNGNIHVDYSEAKRYIWDNINSKINNKKIKINIEDYNLFPKGLSNEDLINMKKYFDSFIKESLKNIKKHNLI